MFGPILGLLIVTILFIVICINAGKCFESKKWPRTRGVITYNKVHLFMKDDAFTGSGGLSVGGNRKVPDYDLIIEYKYRVHGKNYTNDVIEFLRGESNNYFIEKLIGKNYPIGKKVDVYYNPRTPSESCLKPGLSLGAITGFIICFVLFSACGAWLVNV